MLSKTIAPYVVKYTQPPHLQGVVYSPVIPNQESLDAFLLSQPKVGDWVTFKNAGNACTPYMVNRIVEVNNTFNTLKIGYGGQKETHLLAQLGAMDIESAWCRWASILDYRLVTPEEMQRLRIEDAILQNFIQNITPEVARKRIR